VAHVDPILGTAPVAGITEPHQRTIDGIPRAGRQGVFTAAEVDLLIDRSRVHASVSPVESQVSGENNVPAAPGGHATSALPHGPDGTVS
jgi:hypothetical protein